MSLHFWCIHSNFFSCQNKTWNSRVYTFDVYTQISFLVFIVKIKPAFKLTYLALLSLLFLSHLTHFSKFAGSTYSLAPQQTFWFFWSPSMFKYNTFCGWNLDLILFWKLLFCNLVQIKKKKEFFKKFLKNKKYHPRKKLWREKFNILSLCFFLVDQATTLYFWW